MNKLLEQLKQESELQHEDGTRFFFLQLADGQVVEVILNQYTAEELDEEMKSYRDSDSMDLYGFMGSNTTDEKVEMGFFMYFKDQPVKVIESADELEAARPTHEAHWKRIQEVLDNA